VSVSTSHEDFPFQENDDTKSCFKFCQSLPNYSSQTGMMVKHQTPRSNDGKIVDALSCTCLYQNDKLPSRELLPSYATASPPTFTLTNSDGMALGLRPNVGCNSEEALGIETQISDPNSPRQQFQLTHDGQFVSVKCPEKVLTAELDGWSCTAGVGLQLSEPEYLILPKQVSL